ncbi:hypothetical protein HAALTHF_45760n [Vreelandella aquamarina]|nr:hypothetical protein HAALTHF_45760n [Halomonas axialensis]
MELLMADQPSRAQSPDRSSHFWEVADQLAVDEAAVKSWLPPRRKAAVSHAAAMPTVSQPDTSHPAMHVNLDACITCNLCVRACREVQSNDVIGMAQRGAAATVVFDFADSMGQSTCVGCGECVQACPTGALMPATVVNTAGQGDSQSQRQVDSVPLLRGGLPADVPY